MTFGQNIHSGFILADNQDINLGSGGKIVGLLNTDQNKQDIPGGAVTTLLASVPDLSSNIQDGDTVRIEGALVAGDAASGCILTIEFGASTPVSINIPASTSNPVFRFDVSFTYQVGTGTVRYMAFIDDASAAGIPPAVSWNNNMSYAQAGAWDMNNPTDWSCLVKFTGQATTVNGLLYSFQYALIKSDA